MSTQSPPNTQSPRPRPPNTQRLFYAMRFANNAMTLSIVSRNLIRCDSLLQAYQDIEFLHRILVNLNFFYLTVVIYDEMF